MEKFYKKDVCVKVISVVVLLIVALCSIFVISKFAANPESYKTTIQSIDEKKTKVMGITAAAAATSTLLAAVPGDATTPIANQILEISSYLMIVVCALVLEKSLLTVMGYLAFNILIPAACGLLGIHTFFKREFLRTLALKCVIFAVVIVGIVPISLKIGDVICETNSASVEQAAENVDNSAAEDSGGGKSRIDDMLDKFKKGVSDAEDYAKQKLNYFIDAVAIFIIAYCAIPIIVVVAAACLFKIIFGMKLPQNKTAELGRNAENKSKIIAG